MTIDVTSYLGLPWRLGARGPDAFDCWGLTVAIYRDVFHVELPSHDTIGLSDREVAREIVGEVQNCWTEIDRAKIRDGDVFFQSSFGRPYHTGLTVGLYALHAHEAAGVVVEPLARLDGQLTFYRHRDLLGEPGGT